MVERGGTGQANPAPVMAAPYLFETQPGTQPAPREPHDRGSEAQTHFPAVGRLYLVPLAVKRHEMAPSGIIEPALQGQLHARLSQDARRRLGIEIDGATERALLQFVGREVQPEVPPASAAGEVQVGVQVPVRRVLDRGERLRAACQPLGVVPVQPPVAGGDVPHGQHSFVCSRQPIAAFHVELPAGIRPVPAEAGPASVPEAQRGAGVRAHPQVVG